MTEVSRVTPSLTRKYGFSRPSAAAPRNRSEISRTSGKSSMRDSSATGAAGGAGLRRAGRDRRHGVGRGRGDAAGATREMRDEVADREPPR